MEARSYTANYIDRYPIIGFTSHLCQLSDIFNPRKINYPSDVFLITCSYTSVLALLWVMSILKTTVGACIINIPLSLSFSLSPFSMCFRSLSVSLPLYSFYLLSMSSLFFLFPSLSLLLLCLLYLSSFSILFSLPLPPLSLTISPHGNRSLHFSRLFAYSRYTMRDFLDRAQM